MGIEQSTPSEACVQTRRKKVESFVNEEYPEILRRAESEDAEIYFGDETGADNVSNYEKGYASPQNPPIQRVETHRERTNVLITLTKDGKLRYTVFNKSMSQQKLIEFLRVLVRCATKKIFLFLDNLRVHHGKLVKKWLEAHKDEIEVFYFPSYSPELNPVEYLNNALKHYIHSGEHPRVIADIEHKIRSFMAHLQRNKPKAANFFKHHLLCYC
jgi:transposase